LQARIESTVPQTAVTVQANSGRALAPIMPQLLHYAGVFFATPVADKCDLRLGHVWTAPTGQGIFWLSACGRVQVMCPACLRGAHDRWPWCDPQIGSLSKPRARQRV